MSKYTTIRASGYWADTGESFEGMTLALEAWDGVEDWEDEGIFYYLDGAPPLGAHDDFVITEVEQ